MSQPHYGSSPSGGFPPGLRGSPILRSKFAIHIHGHIVAARPRMLRRRGGVVPGAPSPPQQGQTYRHGSHLPEYTRAIELLNPGLSPAPRSTFDTESLARRTAGVVANEQDRLVFDEARAECQSDLTFYGASNGSRPL